ncbi:MAG: sulfatase-like hydrolase/transferase, partial [Verrucomicrobiales bacterium]|nr:sulfatase-like hydrolase/transferase [Verrucomicrobiales bacterium]
MLPSKNKQPATTMRSILLLLTTAFLTSAPAAERPPNIVLVLVDDLGWMDLSCQGSDYYKTPNIDALATGG